MKVLDLQCALGHVFEAWFASEQDFQDQLAKGLLRCPLCDEGRISKLPSAPRLQLGSKHSTSSSPSSPFPSSSIHEAKKVTQGCEVNGIDPQPLASQAAWMAWSRQVMASLEDVGADFSTIARQMHEGDIPERPIRGEAPLAQVLELLEEGVPVLPLAVSAASKETLQ